MKNLLLISLLLFGLSCNNNLTREQKLKQFSDSLDSVKLHKIDSAMNLIDETMPDNYIQTDSSIIDLTTGEEIIFWRK